MLLLTSAAADFRSRSQTEIYVNLCRRNFELNLYILLFIENFNGSFSHLSKGLSQGLFVIYLLFIVCYITLALKFVSNMFY